MGSILRVTALAGSLIKGVCVRKKFSNLTKFRRENKNSRIATMSR